MRLRRLSLAALLLTGGLQACSNTASADTVAILASWTGAEETSFRKVLAAFEADEQVKVNYLGTRALGQVLQTEVQKGTPPDIAMLPSPWEVAIYARNHYLKPLNQQDGDYSQQWLKLEKIGMPARYAVAVKADLKSAIWFNPARLGEEKPRTGAELMDLGKRIAARGETPWCMGVGSTPDSGWPGTDWIEDILLHQSGTDVYRRWAAGTVTWDSPEVRRAWTTWGELVDGKRPALLTDFGDAGRPLFDERPGCLLDHQASFIMGTYQGYQLPGGKSPRVGTDFDFFPFPSFGDTPRAWVVSADLAVMFNDSGPAQKLIRYLASPKAQKIWPQDGGAFSANAKVDPRETYRDDVSRRIAETLASSDTLCFDGSDLMPAPMRTAFYRAVLEYLNDRSRLDDLLNKLERVRAGLDRGEWLDVPC